MSVRTEVELGGRNVVLTNLDRVMWPAAALTKQWLVDYYVAVAEPLIPHLAGRPLTLARFPEGLDRPGFLQNECRGRPSWMHVQALTLRDGTVRRYCVIDDLPSLAWVANLGTVELHPYLSRGDDRPLAVVFDLDPHEGTAALDAWRVALDLRERLAGRGLRSFAKTSGATGLHVFVPLNTPHRFEETRTFAREVADELAAAQPDRVSASTRPADRAGHVFVDWLQNDPRRSTVAPYSLRASEPPGVSTPLAWAEVEAVVAAGQPDARSFTPDEVLERLRRTGDAFAPVVELRQRLDGN